MFVCYWRDSPQWAMASSFTRFLDHTQRRTTVCRTPLDEWSARRRDLYLTIHNTHNRQTSMLAEGFESTISAGERPQTYVLDRAATGTGPCLVLLKKYYWVIISRRRRCSTYVGNLRQRNCFEDLGSQYMGRYWNWSLKIGWEDTLWIDLVEDKGLGRAVMSTIMKIWVP